MVTMSSAPRRRLWLLIFAGCVIAGVLDALQAALQGVFGFWGTFRWQTVTFQGVEWLFLGGLTLLTYALSQRYPLRRPRLSRALLVHSAGALVLCVAWATMGALLRRGLEGGGEAPFVHELASWMLTSVPWSFFLYFAVLGSIHAFTYYVEARDRELVATQLSGQLAEARLRALRAQLQPHFLFNTLNAITVLVRDRRGALAVRMLDLLSDMLRHVLRPDQPHEIPLRDELQLVKQYLGIEQIRYSDRLQLIYEIDDNTLDARVPSFVLQPLIENALRHGVADVTEGARLEITARRVDDLLELTVRDNGRGLGHGRGTGMGLDNTRERLAALYGESARLTLADHPEGGAVARIVLPWRPAEQA